MAKSPTKGTQRLSAQVGIIQNNVMPTLRANKLHPYKLQMLQHLAESDPDRSVEFCEWTLNVRQDVSGQNCLVIGRLSLSVDKERDMRNISCNGSVL
ncbi:hypothetical protein AVEN_227134-1 [Araneus ventricosus]|uniref:Uncharacterized protein n=1 Tax=Araneus ventricosus TaxID=182803 RepID=A0A4Y2BX62_ARAVE|nr:hypothetical protein AVEN_227134-1 [Araneus ventricosus]